MKQTILVTGGTGFIGSHTTVELQQAGYEVVIVDNLSNSKIEVLDGIEKITGVRPAFENVDLRDLEATETVFRKYPKIEGIIHFAASKAVGEPLGIDAEVQCEGNYILVKLHCLWTANTGESACYRKSPDTESTQPIRKYQAD